MREILNVPHSSILPEKGEVFALQGIPQGIMIPDRINNLYLEAFSLYEETLDPKGLIADISNDILEEILASSGKDSLNSVVSSLFRESDDLALYTFTLGRKISDLINELFRKNEFALGSMLDSVASAATDRGGEYGERFFHESLEKERKNETKTRVLMYSPGYCGWNITGQQKLFENLDPAEIGISLNTSSLMTPIKSISGILVSGNKKIHYIKENFTFCKVCSGKSCRERVKKIKQET